MTQAGSTAAPALPSGRLSTQPQPQLTVAGLTLRPWEAEDIVAVVRAYADPDIHRWHCRSMSLRQAESWIKSEAERWEQERGGSWAITRDNAVLGRVGVGAVSLAEARAGITYWVLPAARGGGVAVLALGAVAGWAFDDVGFHRLEVEHSTKNPASCRVAAKAGFVAEGTKRAHGLHLDGWHDMHAHGLLADDPRPTSRGS